MTAIQTHRFDGKQWRRPTSELLDRSPPHSLDAEKGVLGSVLLDPSKLADVASIIKPTDFHGHANELLFAHLLAMHAAGVPIDTTTVCARLKQAGDLEVVGGTAYLADVLQAVPVAAHAEYYARIVRDKARLRAVRETCLEALQQVYSGQTSGEALTQWALGQFQSAADQEAKVVFPVRTLAELVADESEPEFYVAGLFCELQPLVIAGPMKSLKTSILAALMFALATGTRFLGRFPVTRAVRCALLSAESGERAIRNLFIRIAEAAGFDPADVTALCVGEKIPTIDDPEHEVGLRQLILDRELEIVAFDPLYLGNDEESQSNLTRQGRQLRRLTEVCLDLGVTPIICHHTKKGTLTKHEPLDLSDIHGSGTGEFARQWWLVNRRTDYRDDGRHELWFRVGASYGHGGCFAVDVDEGVWDGPGSRYWKVNVLEPDDAKTTAKQARQESKKTEAAEKVEADRAAIVNTMIHVAAEGGTQRDIRDACPFGGSRFQRAWSTLIQDRSILKAGTIKKANGHSYDTWRLNDDRDL